MYSRQKVLWAVVLLFPMILCVNASGYQVTDNDVPEVTARVARVTFISGDVQIKRSGSDDWERVTQNLPVVEGDEIATDANARAEIQLNSVGHLRLDANSFLKVVTLKDEGVALSVPQGTLSVRLLEFDKSKSYLEIDAPKTTIAVQKAGLYRVDAGSATDKQVRVTVTESGEARVYSDNSGFTLKNGRRSSVNIDGNLEGEWETTDAARYADDFDSWALDRDVAIAKKLKDAYYDKYYDRDIYGAEDLDQNGEWIHTNKYGYVWRPYGNVTSRYSDWSPYRYGEWRWIPPFGWTWVNDEPWGWATYHHGRWFYDDGYWYWSPYGYYRNRRSWWSPALVVITIFSGNICWYPLPYQYAYYDYNSYYYGGGRHRGRRDRQPTPNPQPSPAPSPVPPGGGGGPIKGPGRMRSMPYYQVPIGGVVTVPGNSFGTGKGDIKKAPPEIAKGVLAKNPDDENTMPRLPKLGDIADRIGGRIRVEKPIEVREEARITTGAMNRKAGAPLDDELRTTRVMGKRPPVQSEPGEKPTPRIDKGGTVLRDTGAVGRPVTLPAGDTLPVKSIPRSEEIPKQETPKVEVPRNDTPRKAVEPRREQPKEEPRYDPPTKRVEPRNDPPKREEPRYTPPPKLEQPRSDPPPKRDDPPAKSVQPKEERKPSPDSGRKKDGR